MSPAQASGDDQLRGAATMNILQKLPFLVLTACAFLCGSAAGAEMSTQETPQMTVRLSDLNLSKPEDVARLYGRLRHAARLVCNDASAPWDARRTSNLIRCYKGALEAAVLRVNQPLLTDLHERMTSNNEG